VAPFFLSFFGQTKKAKSRGASASKIQEQPHQMASANSAVESTHHAGPHLTLTSPATWLLICDHVKLQ